jgi:hypothetical protein
MDLVEVGGYVSAFWEEDGYFYPAQVVDLYEDDWVLVEFLGFGQQLQLHASQLLMIRTGIACAAQWDDFNFYPARITAILPGGPDSRVRVRYLEFEEAGEAELERTQIKPIEFVEMGLHVDIDDTDDNLLMSIRVARSQSASSSPSKPKAEEENLTPEQKKEKKRKRITLEILDTEKAYVKFLEVLATVWMAPLETRGSETLEAPSFDDPKGLLPPDVFKMIFSNIKTILSLHQKFLAELSVKVAADPQGLEIGNLFNQYAPFFKVCQIFLLLGLKLSDVYSVCEQLCFRVSTFG